MMSRISYLLALCLFLSVWQSSAQAADDYELVVKRSENLLLVEKDGHVLKSLPIAYGSGIGAKQLSGDRRTPVGKYKIMAIRQSDKFHLFMQLNYPNVRDAINGLKQHHITQAEYRQILDAHIYQKMPPQDTPLGGQIGIHGIGLETPEKLDIHKMANWTQGCIALRNKEIDWLAHFVHPGTVITIEE